MTAFTLIIAGNRYEVAESVQRLRGADNEPTASLIKHDQRIVLVCPTVRECDFPAVVAAAVSQAWLDVTRTKELREASGVPFKLLQRDAEDLVPRRRRSIRKGDDPNNDRSFIRPKAWAKAKAAFGDEDTPIVDMMIALEDWTAPASPRFWLPIAIFVLMTLSSEDLLLALEAHGKYWKRRHRQLEGEPEAVDDTPAAEVETSAPAADDEAITFTRRQFREPEARRQYLTPAEEVKLLAGELWPQIQGNTITPEAVMNVIRERAQVEAPALEFDDDISTWPQERFDAARKVAQIAGERLLFKQDRASIDGMIGKLVRDNNALRDDARRYLRTMRVAMLQVKALEQTKLRMAEERNATTRDSGEFAESATVSHLIARALNTIDVARIVEVAGPGYSIEDMEAAVSDVRKFGHRIAESVSPTAGATRLRESIDAAAGAMEEAAEPRH